MPWPFSTSSGPLHFSGPGAQVPSVSASIAIGVSFLLGLHFINGGDDDHIVTVTDAAGNIVWKDVIPAHSGSPPYSPTFEPVTGLKWFVDAGTDVVGHAWGY